MIHVILIKSENLILKVDSSNKIVGINKFLIIIFSKDEKETKNYLLNP